MLIDIATFRLRGEAEEGAFLEADRRMQTEFIPNLLGFVRRTTARDDAGGWAVITLWWSATEADAAAALAAGDPVAGAFDALVDPATVERRRYTTLD